MFKKLKLSKRFDFLTRFPIPKLKTKGVLGSVCLFLWWNIHFSNIAKNLTVYDKLDVASFIEQGDWQNVNHFKYKYLIYSAYSFGDHQIVIIGSPTPFARGEKKSIYCLFYNNEMKEVNSKPEMIKTKATLESMRGWGPKIDGTFVRCPLPNLKYTKQEKPAFVSVLLNDQSESPARLPIHYRNLHHNYRPINFSVCVLPLYSYNDAFHFLEWVEFYKLMGVSQFTFYNISIGPEVSCIMNHYRKPKDGVTMKVNPWHKYPQKKDISIRYGVGLTSGHNECWYSHKGVTKFMIFVDVDEFIVPLQGVSNYYQLMQNLETTTFFNNSNRFGEYIFRNGFYLKSREKDYLLPNRCAEVKDIPTEFETCKQLWTMQYVERDPLRSWKSRTKNIARPESARVAGNHYFYKLEEGWKSMRVPDNVAFLRHYRYFKEANTTTVERMPLNMGISLAKNVAKSVNYFKYVCS